jgi:hypothetical protein
MYKDGGRNRCVLFRQTTSVGLSGAVRATLKVGLLHMTVVSGL